MWSLFSASENIPHCKDSINGLTLDKPGNLVNRGDNDEKRKHY